MATKKQIEKLENLLEWQREDRLFENIELFNQQISPSLIIREVSERKWELEAQHDDENGKTIRFSMPLTHKTLVNLGLTILDAITKTRNR